MRSEMLDFKRRMPRFEIIPQMRATEEKIDSLKKSNFKNDKITVIKLRRAKLDFENYDQLTIDVMKQKSPNDDRTK
jgi:hypothetical protein